MGRTSGSSFLFITGMVRALENRLLGSSIIESMLRAKDESETLNVLRNTAYSAFPSLIAEPFSTVNLVETARTELYSFIDKNSMDTYAGCLFRTDHDYHNMKILLSRKLSGVTPGDILSTHGTFDVEYITAIFDNEDYALLPPVMRRSVSEAIEEYFLSKRSSMINSVFDRHMFSDMLSSTPCAVSSLAEAYIMRRIDAANIMTLIRLNRYGQRESKGEYLFINGGVISADEFAEGIGEPLKALTGIAVKHDLAGVYSALNLKEYMPYAVERECRKLMLGAIEPADFMISGVEPLLAYGIRAEMELRAIGMILSSKKPEFDRKIAEILLRQGGEG